MNGVRKLTGEHPEAYEIRVSADTPNVYAEVLKRATKLVRKLDPENVDLLGIHWSESTDAMCLTLYISHPHPVNKKSSDAS